MNRTCCWISRREQHTGWIRDDNFQHDNRHTVIGNATKNFSKHVSLVRMCLCYGGLAGPWMLWWCSEWLMPLLINNALYVLLAQRADRTTQEFFALLTRSPASVLGGSHRIFLVLENIVCVICTSRAVRCTTTCPSRCTFTVHIASLPHTSCKLWLEPSSPRSCTCSLIRKLFDMPAWRADSRFVFCLWRLLLSCWWRQLFVNKGTRHIRRVHEVLVMPLLQHGRTIASDKWAASLTSAASEDLLIQSRVVLACLVFWGLRFFQIEWSSWFSLHLCLLCSKGTIHRRRTSDLHNNTNIDIWKNGLPKKQQ